MKPVRTSLLAPGILGVVIDRPEKRNACNVPTWEALADTFEQAARDTGVRVLVLSGAGGHFCAGDDIAASARFASDPQQLQRRIEAIAQAFRALRALPFPVIAAIEGVCVGLGCAMASYADFRVAGPSARIGISAARQATAYATAHLPMLVSLIGLRAARRWLYGAALHDAATAAADGFVDEVATDVVQQALRSAGPLLEKSPLSLAIARAQLDAIATGELAARSADLEAMMQKVRGSEDRREAIRAFIEKRAPRFTGR